MFRTGECAACVAAALACVCAGAWAGPRESVTFANMNSDGATGGFGSGSHAFAGGYPVTHIVVSGTLQSLVAASYAREAVIYYATPGVAAPYGALVPFQQTSPVFGSVSSGEVIFRLPRRVADAVGNWGFLFEESYDDGPGVDAQWTTVTITLVDGPPATMNVGALTAGTVGTPAVSLSAGEVRWYKFDVQGPVRALSGTYLDIDTEGSALTLVNDTQMFLYNDDGALVAFDDDDGSGNLSQLTFGAGTRPSAGPGGLMYDGRDGDLSAGVYYLAVSAYHAGTIAAAGWGVNSAGFYTGTVRVNIRTNIGVPVFCAGDFNRTGVVSVQDIFDFLAAWFAGCP